MRHDFLVEYMNFALKYMCILRYDLRTLTNDFGKIIILIIMIFSGTIYMTWISTTALDFKLIHEM